MQALESLERKINSADKLLSIVKTMKALATANMRQYEKAVESLEDYYLTVEMGLQVALKELNKAVDDARVNKLSHVQADKGATIAVIFGSDYGFAGRFNDEIVAFALSGLNKVEKEKTRRVILCVGEQAHSRLVQKEQTVQALFAIPNSLQGINPLVRKILLEIEVLREKKQLGRALLFFNKPVLGAAFTQHMETLIPIEPDALHGIGKKWPARSIPTFTMDAGRLLSALIHQYVFVNLYRGFALSMAAENASRLAAMQAAGKNIEELLEQIRSEYRRNRQSAITEELLEIASGFMALGGD